MFGYCACSAWIIAVPSSGVWYRLKKSCWKPDGYGGGVSMNGVASRVATVP